MDNKIDFRRALAACLVAITALFVSAVAVAQQPHTLTGDIRIHRNFHSKILNNDRDVLVYLPQGYDLNSKKRYPVLYLHDGQNVFDGATSFIPGQEWQVDETAQRLISDGEIEPIIIVAIYNTGKDRIDEYTATVDAKLKAGGKAKLYGRMIVEELKPFVDTNYRTSKDSVNTGIGGSSLGGLVSLYIGLKYPDVFGRVAAVSPSVWWDDNQIVRYVEETEKRTHLRIWLDVGTKEGRNAAEAQQTVDGARKLRDALTRNGYRLSKDLDYFEAEGAAHNESAWAARVGQILKFLYPKRK